MHAMTKRLAVQVLRNAGHTQGDVAAHLGLSEQAVRRIEREDPVASFDDSAERARRGIGRPSKVDAFRERVAQILRAESEVMTLEVLRRLREDGYRGGKSAVYDLVAALRPASVKPLVRFEGVPGEFCQHDFGHVEVRWVDGTRKRVHFFASRLKWSRWTEVTIVPNEQAETLVRTLVLHYERMSGVPLMGVFDRPKTIAIEWDKAGRVTHWNSTFLQTMGELSVAPELCWPYSPQQKGSVENLVGWVKGSFFKSRRFVDERDLLMQLERWHHEVNTERPSRATNEIPETRMQREERARLRPLKVTSETLTLRFPVQVGPTGMVTFEGRRYSMPPQAIGLSGTLHLGKSSLKIVAGRWSAKHERLFERDAKSILPEHRTAMVAEVSGSRGKNYLKREHLLGLGAVALEYITELVHRRPRTWSRDVDKMHELLSLHGDDAVRVAITQALEAETFGAEYVGHHLGELDRLARMVFVGEVRQ
jgi:transposase